jgi:hypothetical protein
LCFEASNVPRFRGQSPLVYRWLEGWAAGCAIVGKRPFGKGVAELIDWQDSTIEIPDDPQDWIPFFEAWLNDEDRLARISVRNQIECRLRHDWRYRLRSIFQQFSLPIPELLTAEIAQLQTCLQPADALKQSLPVLDQDTDRTQAPEPQEIPLRVLS